MIIIGLTFSTPEIDLISSTVDLQYACKYHNMMDCQICSISPTNFFVKTPFEESEILNKKYRYIDQTETEFNAQIVNWENECSKLQVEVETNDNDSHSLVDAYIPLIIDENFKYENFCNEDEINEICPGDLDTEVQSGVPSYSPISSVNNTTSQVVGEILDHKINSVNLQTIPSHQQSKPDHCQQTNEVMGLFKISNVDNTMNGVTDQTEIHKAGSINLQTISSHQLPDSWYIQQIDEGLFDAKSEQSTFVDIDLTTEVTSLRTSQPIENIKIPNKKKIDRFLQAKTKKTLTATDVRRSCATMKSLLHSYLDLGNTVLRNLCKDSLVGDIKQSLQRHSDLLLNCAGIYLTSSISENDTD